ncbi:MAG TPA: ATP-binding cassette domain-containing protein, partial [Acetobacteraceae bacterium]|nr:ATP-binding cassette domain-containing protein [Acetobacteraceae bacterium]
MASLSVLGVAKHFGQAKVLESVNFTVASGEVLAVLGASGSGKTSLLRLIAGFERVDGGSIEIGGEQVSGLALHVPPEKRRVGYV